MAISRQQVHKTATASTQRCETEALPSGQSTRKHSEQHPCHNATCSSSLQANDSSPQPSKSSTVASPTKQVHQKLNVELCAGSAGYSAKIFKLGLSALPIDYGSNRHKCVTLDLTLESSQTLLLRLLEEEDFLHRCCTTMRHGQQGKRKNKRKWR